MSHTKNLTVVKGTNRTITITVKDDDDATVDITGATVYFRVKERPSDTDNAIAKSSAVAAQVTILNQSTNRGQAEIYLVPADTSSLDEKTYWYDVWVQLANGKRYPVVTPEGPARFKVVAPVTVL